MEYLVKPWAHQLECIERAAKVREFGLFFEMGCITGDAVVRVSRSGNTRKYTLADLYRKFNHKNLTTKERGFRKNTRTFIRSWLGDRYGLNRIKAVVESGEKKVFMLKLASGKTITLTEDHEVFTKHGWVRARDLQCFHEIATDNLVRHQKKELKKKSKKLRYNAIQVGIYHPHGYQKYHPYSGKKIATLEVHRVIFEAHLNNMDVDEFVLRTRGKSTADKLKYVNPKTHHIHHKDKNHKNNEISNLCCLEKEEHLREHGDYKHFNHGQITWDAFSSLSFAGIKMTYDICCEEPHHNFVANGILVHNSGKTPTTINILRHKFLDHKRLLKTLVLCPVVVVENWKREFKTHSKVGDFVTVLKGTGKQKAKQVKDLMSKPQVVVTNYESLMNEEVFNALLVYGFEAIVCDESQRLKNIKAVRTKKTIQLADLTTYRYILSGSPILNSPMDIFAQYRVLDKGATFGKNFFEFRARYFYDKNAGMPTQKHFPDWRPLPGIEKVFNNMIYRKAMRVLKKDCMDLPPLVRMRHVIELTNEQRKAYKEMLKECIAYLDSGVTIAEIALTRTLRLMQIVSGFVKLADESAHRFADNPKRAALKELLEDLTPEHKVIVWATFKDNYEMIGSVCDELEIKHRFLIGGLTQDARQKAVDDFQNDKDVRVIIANQAAGGVGVNLTAASYSIFFSRDFSLESDMQAEARNYRGGSDIHAKITRIDIVAKDTIDEHVLECLYRKENLAQDILRVRSMLNDN